MYELIAPMSVLQAWPPASEPSPQSKPPPPNILPLLLCSALLCSLPASQPGEIPTPELVTGTLGWQAGVRRGTEQGLAAAPNNGGQRAACAFKCMCVCVLGVNKLEDTLDRTLWTLSSGEGQ